MSDETIRFDGRNEIKIEQRFEGASPDRVARIFQRALLGPPTMDQLDADISEFLNDVRPAGQAPFTTKRELAKYWLDTQPLGNKRWWFRLRVRLAAWLIPR